MTETVAVVVPVRPIRRHGLSARSAVLASKSQGGGARTSVRALNDRNTLSFGCLSQLVVERGDAGAGRLGAEQDAAVRHRQTCPGSKPGQSRRRGGRERQFGDLQIAQHRQDRVSATVPSGDDDDFWEGDGLAPRSSSTTAARSAAAASW